MIKLEMIGQMDNSKDHTHESSNRVYSPEGLAPTLNTCQGGGLQPKIVDLQRVEIPQEVQIREFDVDVNRLQQLLKQQKAVLNLSCKDIAEQLDTNLTTVEHWFRLDSYFSIPEPEIWPKLSKLLQIQDKELNKQIMSFVKCDGKFEKSERHYLDTGLAPTIVAGNNDKIIVAMRGRDENKPTNRKRQTPENKFKQQLEIQDGLIANSLTTATKDNLVLEPKVVQRVGDRDKENYSVKDVANCIPANPMSDREQVVCIKQATKQGYVECELGGVADFSYPDSKLRRGRVQEGGTVSPTLLAGNSDIMRIEPTPTLIGGLGEKNSNGGTQYYQQDRVYDTNGVAMAHPAQIPEGSYKYMVEERTQEKMQYRIRKLTPKECFRLMGVKDEDYDKLTVSNSQRYKQAGNSIVVDVLMAIFENMFINECESNSLF